MTYTLHLGDCIDAIRAMPDNSVDSIVTDPPYGLTANKNGGSGVASINLESPYGRARIGTGNGAGGFMGMKWDNDVPPVEVWAECLRVLKPGGYLLAFAGARTQHRMAVRIEDAGFEIRDMIAWVYGSGFPKSRNISQMDMTGEDAERWEGWGTALKPALEPITVARKPLIGTVAANVLAHGTGALNIDGCRVGWPDGKVPEIGTPGWGGPAKKLTAVPGQEGATVERSEPNTAGRWPANLIHDGSDEVVAQFPATESGKPSGVRNASKHGGSFSEGWGDIPVTGFGDKGSAARFFYCAKTAKKDRGEGNYHPTVKPTDLMAYLCRLVTPPGGVVLDPFMGSGSTGKAAMREGFQFIGCELDPEYMAIAKARIEHELAKVTAARQQPTESQLSLFGS